MDNMESESFNTWWKAQEVSTNTLLALVVQEIACNAWEAALDWYENQE